MSGRSLEFTAEFISDEDDLEPGDHISVECKAAGLTIHHHGIVVKGKNNLKVVNFSSNQKKGGRGHDGIKKQSITEFRDTEPITKVMKIIYKPGNALPPEKVVERAEMFHNDPWKFDEYHYLHNNCEHFATYCKADMKYSGQTRLGGMLEILAKSYVERVKSGGKWKGK